MVIKWPTFFLQGYNSIWYTKTLEEAIQEAKYLYDQRNSEEYF